MAGLVTVWACSRTTCKEAGCFAWTKVTYSTPVPGPYELTVSTQGLTASARCPQPLQQAPTQGAQQARLGCTESSFELSVASTPAGTGRYGSNPVDADPITFRVTVTPLDPGGTPWTGVAHARITGTERPNGPECLPTCYGRSGTLAGSRSPTRP